MRCIKEVRQDLINCGVDPANLDQEILSLQAELVEFFRLEGMDNVQTSLGIIRS